jgi:hypothetical protein
MNRRFSIRNATVRVILGAACLCPLMAGSPCSKTTLKFPGRFAGVQQGETLDFNLDGIWGPIVKGTDPLGLNGQESELFIDGLSASETPISSTADSATYLIPGGDVYFYLSVGILNYYPTSPWKMKITLGAKSDTVEFSGLGPSGTSLASTSLAFTVSLPPGTWTTAVLSNPTAPNPGQPTVLSGNVEYSLGCFVSLPASTDYFFTGAGTSVRIGNKTYPLTGVPLNSGSLGNTDTTVMGADDVRFTPDSENAASPDATPTTPTTPAVYTVGIQLTALSLTGTSGTLPNHACTMNIAVLGSPASTGTMYLTIDAAGDGGTFWSVLNIQYTVTFTPISPNTNCPAQITSQHTLTLGRKPGGIWSTTPGPNLVLVQGTYPDPNANQFTGLPAGYTSFYATNTAAHEDQTIKHFVCAAVTTAGATCQ